VDKSARHEPDVITWRQWETPSSAAAAAQAIIVDDRVYVVDCGNLFLLAWAIRRRAIA